MVYASNMFRVIVIAVLLIQISTSLRVTFLNTGLLCNRCITRIQAKHEIPTGYKISERFEKRAKDGNPLLHFEILRERETGIFNMFSRPSAPIGKVGMRPQSASTKAMDKCIQNCFGIEKKDVPVGVLVYMWVDPDFRGNGIGLILLECVKKRCLEKGMEYLLLIHDDDGSGRLITFYEKQGFQEIFSFIEKGMLAKILAQ